MTCNVAPAARVVRVVSQRGFYARGVFSPGLALHLVHVTACRPSLRGLRCGGVWWSVTVGVILPFSCPAFSVGKNRPHRGYGSRAPVCVAYL